MSHTPNYDAKVKAILNATKPGEQICALLGEKWNRTEEEIGWYRKFNVPPLPYAPNTFRKWMAYYDLGYQFWWNKHFDTGKPVLSFHHPATGIRVLPDVEWHARDFSDIQSDYDAQKPFFSQLQKLQHRVPMLATFNTEIPQNSIALFTFGDKDSLFTFACRSIRAYYSAGGMDIEDSSLVFLGAKITQSHWTGHSHNLHKCFYVRESMDCLESAFLFDCRNCEYCFGATNRRNKKYLWFNEQLSKAEWEKRRATVDLGRRDILEAWQKKFDDLVLHEAVWPENFNTNTNQSSGEYLTNAVRCVECFDSEDAPTDNFRCDWMFGVTNGNAYNWGTINNSDCYCNVSSPQSNRTKFCYRCPRMEDSEYCFMSSDCQNCFGCVGLKRKKFCIFNKQYTEAEYWKRMDELKCAMLDRKEYGMFFPVELSSTYVPESGAVNYCGATPEEIEKMGGLRFDPTAEGATGEGRIDPTKVRQASEIPNSIDDLTDAWVGVPIYDLEAKRTFSFHKAEIEHYRALRIAPSTKHFIRRLRDVAHSGQMAQLDHAACAQCSKDMLVSRSIRYPNRRILCNSCYLKHIESTN